jgi:hypothetical protein
VDGNLNTDDPADGDRPWERPGAVRRDSETHRRRLLRALGLTSLVLSALGVALVIPALLALPLGLAVWAAARRDLRRMNAGAMDPGGRDATTAGRDYGALGALLSLLAIPKALFLAVVLSFRPGV